MLAALRDGGAASGAGGRLDGEALKNAEAALDVYLALPGWDQGPLAVELSQAAAELAARLGAPVFGGNLLAAAAPVVPAALRADHLLRAAELFLDGGDTARTRLVLEYAETRIAKRRAPRWAAVRAAAGGAPGGGGRRAARARAPEDAGRRGRGRARAGGGRRGRRARAAGRRRGGARAAAPKEGAGREQGEGRPKSAEAEKKPEPEKKETIK